MKYELQQNVPALVNLLDEKLTSHQLFGVDFAKAIRRMRQFGLDCNLKNLRLGEQSHYSHKQKLICKALAAFKEAQAATRSLHCTSSDGMFEFATQLREDKLKKMKEHLDSV